MTNTLVKVETIGDTTTVTIGTEIGLFTGSVTCRPEDYPYKSELVGGYLAENKAIVKYYKEKKRLAKAQIHALDNLFKTMCGTRNFNHHDFYVKKLLMQKASLEKEIKQYDTRIQNLKTLYHQEILRRDEYYQGKNK